MPQEIAPLVDSFNRVLERQGPEDGREALLGDVAYMSAIQHAPAATDVCVDIQRHTPSVRDSGAGAGADELPLLFTRFWRGTHRRDQGAGLGLAICQEIALAHGWTLTAERAEPGLRLRLSIRNRQDPPAPS